MKKKQRIQRKRPGAARRGRSARPLSIISRAWRIGLFLIALALLCVPVFWYWSVEEASPAPVPDQPPPRAAVDQPPPAPVVIQVYFGSMVSDAPGSDCSTVFPVERRVSEGDAVARAALVELLKGPTEEESVIGFYSEINGDAELLGVEVDAGVATADFSRAFEKGIAGSCQVETITAQVTRTLMQFPSIQSVRITVEGMVSTAVQP